MKQFEYLVKGSYQEQEDLNKLGAQGWELIHITESRYIYKREKQTEDEAKPGREDEVKVEEVPEGVCIEDEERKRIIKNIEWYLERVDARGLVLAETFLRSWYSR